MLLPDEVSAFLTLLSPDSCLADAEFAARLLKKRLLSAREESDTLRRALMVSPPDQGPDTERTSFPEKTTTPPPSLARKVGEEPLT